MSYIFPAVANGAGSQGDQMQNNMQTCRISCYIMLNVKSTEGCGAGTIDRPLTSQKVGGMATSSSRVSQCVGVTSLRALISSNPLIVACRCE